jgi:hypothetical protein
MKEITVPISPGELLDKITILRIKAKRMADPKKLANVRLELNALEETWHGLGVAAADIQSDIAGLLAVNERLWVIEDEPSISKTMNERPSNAASTSSSAQG